MISDAKLLALRKPTLRRRDRSGKYPPPGQRLLVFRRADVMMSWRQIDCGRSA
jgi:hypothetical protein